EQLELEGSPAAAWNDRRSSNQNFRRFLRREVLGPLTAPLVWGIDEIDRLIACPYATEVFPLFRSGHDQRAPEPGGPWPNRAPGSLRAGDARHLRRGPGGAREQRRVDLWRAPAPDRRAAGSRS